MSTSLSLFIILQYVAKTALASKLHISLVIFPPKHQEAIPAVYWDLLQLCLPGHLSEFTGQCQHINKPCLCSPPHFLQDSSDRFPAMLSQFLVIFFSHALQIFGKNPFLSTAGTVLHLLVMLRHVPSYWPEAKWGR